MLFKVKTYDLTNSYIFTQENFFEVSIEDLYKNFYRSFIQTHVKVIIKHMSNKQRIITKKQDLIIEKKSKITAGNNCLRKTAETENKT